MAFRCEVCKTVQPNGTKINRAVVEVRNVTYPAIFDERGFVKKLPKGEEIAKELTVCATCEPKLICQNVGDKVLTTVELEVDQY